MRLLYTFRHEGVWFSRNGEKAYQRGEKPRFLWPADADLTPTVPHHIARQGSERYRFSRELVMFYKQKDQP